MNSKKADSGNSCSNMPEEGTDIHTTIQHHRSSRHTIDKIVEKFPDGEPSTANVKFYDEQLGEAIELEERARYAFFCHPVGNLEDVRAKARHIRSLLIDGDELGKHEWDLLLRSMI